MPKPDWRCGAARDLPIARDGAWDGPAAAKRMLDAAGIGGAHPKPDIAKRGFLLYDAANANLRGSYKLPFADKIGGKLTAHASGIRAAASRLPQTDAPEREKQRARQIIDHYEARMAEEEKKPDSEKAEVPLLRPTPPHRMPHLAHRIFNTPLAIHPGKASVIAMALAGRFGVGRLDVSGAATAEYKAIAEEYGDGTGDEPARGYVVQNGVAVIPVYGTLTHNLAGVRPMSGMTGYNGIRHNFVTALADPNVRGLMLDVDSPGGEVSGCFELSDLIFGSRGRKPIWAALDDSAFSAAYAIASAADKVLVPELGGVGSIGIITLITDVSKALEAGGVTVNVIQFGARKADGLPVIPLAPAARDLFQADVDVMGERFVEVVARNRKLDVAAVRGTEAATFLGAEGVRRGLADAVMAPDDAFAAFVKSL